MNIGKMQQLTIVRKSDFGLYLAESSDSEEQVLLPKNQVPEGASIGDELTVFLYRDSSDRPIATLKTPRMTLGEIGRCKVAEVSRIGALSAVKNMLRRSMSTGRLPKDYDLFWVNGRMDLLAENLVVDPRYVHLFTAEEIALCRELVMPKAA